jgi:hypothetical protein
MAAITFAPIVLAALAGCAPCRRLGASPESSSCK